MIITRQQPRGWDALLAEKRDIVRIDVTWDSLWFWLEWTDRPFSFDSVKEDSSLHSWLSQYWERMPAVCTEHQRPAPCRGNDGPYGCRFSIEPEDVEAVLGG